MVNCERHEIRPYACAFVCEGERVCENNEHTSIPVPLPLAPSLPDPPSSGDGVMLMELVKPDVQLLGELLPAGEVDREGQFAHVVAVVAAEVVEYLPAPQSTQSTDASFPVVSRYVPALHSKHVLLDAEPVFGEYLPASQLSQAVLIPDDALYLPAWQSSQTVLTPEVALYFPASQLWQAMLTPEVDL